MERRRCTRVPPGWHRKAKFPGGMPRPQGCALRGACNLQQARADHLNCSPVTLQSSIQLKLGETSQERQHLPPPPGKGLLQLEPQAELLD